MNLKDILQRTSERRGTADGQWLAGTIENAALVPSTRDTPQIDVHVRLSKTEMVLARIFVTDDVAPLAAFLRACSEGSAADALERGEHPDLELDHLKGRQVEVQVEDRIVIAFAPRRSKAKNH